MQLIFYKSANRASITSLNERKPVQKTNTKLSSESLKTEFVNGYPSSQYKSGCSSTADKDVKRVRRYSSACKRSNALLVLKTLQELCWLLQ
jgi:hypothetical protein